MTHRCSQVHEAFRATPGTDLALVPCTRMTQQTLTPNVEQAVDRARDTVRDASPGLILLGRCGLAAKGGVYVLIGIAAARVALGTGDETIDSTGALGRIMEMPFGSWLLGAVALGLAGYTVWRAVQALLDTEHKGSDLKGLWARGAYLLSAAAYATLTLAAVRLLVDAGAESASGEGAAQDWTARLLEQPFGPWLVALVGLGLIGSGVFQLTRAVTTKFRDRLQTWSMSAREQTFAVWAGRFGHVARGVTFAIMGIFLVLAAFRQDPGEAKGVAGALNSLAEQPYGPFLLGGVASGLACYGLYMFVEARYRRIVVS
jgi:hypothetical protein